MKNLSKLLAGLVLLLGSCSAIEEGNFLKKVKGKTAYDDATLTTDDAKIGIFSEDGTIFTFDNQSLVLTFVKATDGSVANYTISAVTYLIATTDGKEGTLSTEGMAKRNIWLK